MTALAHGCAPTDEEPTLPPVPNWFPIEPCPDAPPRGPVLAPYLGLVSAVLCALGGSWLLLAPYALDYRQGADRTPRTTEVDLGTGAAIVALAVASAILFAVSLARCLRASEAVDREVVEMDARETDAPEMDTAETETAETDGAQTEAESAAEPSSFEAESEQSVLIQDAVDVAGAPSPAPAPAPAPPTDPGSALRDLLTPLVAALAADLRSRGEQPEGSVRP